MQRNRRRKSHAWAPLTEQRQQIRNFTQPPAWRTDLKKMSSQEEI